MAAWLALLVVLAFGVAAVLVGRQPGTPGAVGILDRLPVAGPPRADLLAEAPDPVAEPASFATWVSGRLDSYWRSAFGHLGLAYRSPTLQLVDHGISIPCFPLVAFEDGAPFYCFLNDTIYLPVPYVADLARSAGATGRIAAAYALAHEYAHHAQHLTGLGDVVEHQLAPKGAPAGRARVAYELQADCLAGVWTSSQIPPTALDPAGAAQALDTAALIRDPGGTAVASHGSLPERHAAFWKGFTKLRCGDFA